MMYAMIRFCSPRSVDVCAVATFASSSAHSEVVQTPHQRCQHDPQRAQPRCRGPPKQLPTHGKLFDSSCGTVADDVSTAYGQQRGLGVVDSVGLTNVNTF